MASPFKHISQLQSLADFTKLTKQVIGKLTEEPVKVQYFSKFKFDKKEAPLLLIGDLPTPVLTEVKKVAGTPLLGQCSLNVAGQLVFEGAVNPGTALKALQAVGIQQQVASSGDDEEGDKPPAEKPAVAKKPPVAPAKPPVPAAKAEAKPPVPPPKQPTPIAKAAKPETKVPTPPKPPEAKQATPAKPLPVPPKQPPSKPATPPPDPAAVVERRMEAVLPLFQKAVDLPGSPEAELNQLYKAASDAATSKDFTAAQKALDSLDTLVSETLAQVKSTSGEAQEAAITGKFAKSRKAWQKAMREAAASISALQAAILKTKDPRATGLASSFKRILKKIPNPAPALEALELATEKKDADAAAKHKTEAKRLANLCTNYLGTDRLVTLATENPFVPVKFAESFKSALQTLNTELK